MKRAEKPIRKALEPRLCRAVNASPQLVQCPRSGSNPISRVIHSRKYVDAIHGCTVSDSAAFVSSSTLKTSRKSASCGSCSGSASSSTSAYRLSTAMRAWIHRPRKRRPHNLQLIQPHQFLPWPLGKPRPRHRHRLQSTPEPLSALQRCFGHALHPAVIPRKEADNQVGLLHWPSPQHHRL